jgi:hypothetical protein
MDGIHACQFYKRGKGPFSEYVILKGYLKGSCSNCHYNANGIYCSLRNREQEKTPTNKMGTEEARLAKEAEEARLAEEARIAEETRLAERSDSIPLEVEYIRQSNTLAKRSKRTT